MNKASVVSRAFALRLLARASRLSVRAATPIALGALSMTLVVGCADEKDPKTWAGRLEDPAQRAPAIKRLDQFFNDAMSTSGDDRNSPKVKAVVDVAIEPLTKAYVAGGLDDKTRRDLIKLISDMADVRAAPAYAKAFKDYEAGKSDDDVKFAAQATTRIAQAGKLTDQALIDALWDCFAKFQPSKAKSINLVKDLQNAIMAVKDPSYGPKAVQKLSAPVTNPRDPAQGLDQIQFWQATSARLVGELKYTAAVPTLVEVLLTPTKGDLSATVRLALTRMPKESEPVLISALKGTDPKFAALAEKFPEKSYIPRVAEPIAYISCPAGNAAILEVLATADNDQNRTILATDLTHFPTDKKNIAALLDAYSKVDPDAAIALMAGGNGHAIIAQSTANFFDPSLTDWLLKETAAAKGDAADAMPPAALNAAMKLMTTAQEKSVGAAVGKIQGQAPEKDSFKSASAVLDKCKDKADCYVSFLDTPVPSSPATAKIGHVKAAWMSAIYGNDQTKQALLGKLEKIKDGSVRFAIAEAVDHLSPKGDAAAAEKLEKIVDADQASGVSSATDSLYKIALKLRSRVP